MPRAALAFRQTHITRALKAAGKAGAAVREALIQPDGSIRLIFELGAGNDSMSALDRWEADHEARTARQRRPAR